MHRKDYQRPEMKVVELRQQCHILAGSGDRNSAGVRDYDWNEYQEE